MLVQTDLAPKRLSKSLILYIGMAISKPLLEQTLEEYRKQMSVNGKVCFLLGSRLGANDGV